MSSTLPPAAPPHADAALAGVLFATAGAGVGIIDRALRYVRVNDALATMNGRSAAAHAGRSVREVLPAASADLLEPLLRRVVERGEPVTDLAVTADVPGAGPRHFLASYHPVREADGTISGAVAVVVERTSAEAALRETAERLRRVDESGIVGLFFWTMDGGITEANDAFLGMLGYTQADLAAGRVDWRRMTPPEYAAPDAAAVRELVATGRHGQYPKEYIGRDGQRVPVVVTSALLAGSPDRGLCVCLDDRARRAAEERLGRVLAQTPAAVAVLLGPDHVVQSANEMFLRLLGRRAYVGKPARTAAPELVEQGFVALMDEVYRSGVPYVGAAAPLVWDRDGDGSRHEGYFDFVYQPIVDAAGAVEGILVFAVEVTAQVRARQATEATAARIAQLQALTAALAGAVTVEDVAAILVAQVAEAAAARTGMLALLGPDPDEATIVRQTGVDDALLARYQRFALTAPGPAARCLRTGEPQWASSRDALRAADPELAAVWDALGACAYATVPLAVAGEVVGAMSFTFDAPRALGPEDRDFFLAIGRQAAQAVERARLFEAERAARAAAEAANRAKSEFLAVMSHELRTPLTAIGGYADLIAMGIRGAVSPEQQTDLARLKRAQQHLLGVITDVLEVANLEAGRARFAVQPVRLGPVLAELGALIEPQADAKGIDYTYAGCSDAAVAEADPGKLRQVVLNLLSNAVKFTPAGGRVRLWCGLDRDAVRVMVQDTGVGIPAEQQEAIFAPFVQLDQALTRAHGGTGLGLAISRELAAGMGGTLSVESEVGVGSTFTLRLRAPAGRPTARRVQ